MLCHACTQPIAGHDASCGSPTHPGRLPWSDLAVGVALHVCACMQKVEDRPAELRCTDAESMMKLWDCVYNPEVSDARIKAKVNK